MYSKYERRTDTRTYDDRRKLYEGGWDVLYAELLEKSWKEKMDEWTGRAKCKLDSEFSTLIGPAPSRLCSDWLRSWCCLASTLMP